MLAGKGTGVLHNQLHPQSWLILQSRDVQSSIIDRGLVILIDLGECVHVILYNG